MDNVRNAALTERPATHPTGCAESIRPVGGSATSLLASNAERCGASGLFVGARIRSPLVGGAGWRLRATRASCLGRICSIDPRRTQWIG